MTRQSVTELLTEIRDELRAFRQEHAPVVIKNDYRVHVPRDVTAQAVIQRIEQLTAQRKASVRTAAAPTDSPHAADEPDSATVRFTLSTSVLDGLMQQMGLKPEPRDDYLDVFQPGEFVESMFKIDEDSYLAYAYALSDELQCGPFQAGLLIDALAAVFAGAR